MARIRHIAIGTNNPEKTARFYIEGLGLKEVGRVNSATAEGYYLSDGHVNLAILKFKSEDPAITEGAPRYTGVHHFGLEVEDMAKARAQFEEAGAVHRPYPGTEEMAKRGNVEVKFSGPDGVTIDLSEHGWLGTGRETRIASRAKPAAAGRMKRRISSKASRTTSARRAV
jgi:catechol 2,3-dioxygenase-like lactoylglutathione lyase family enzyme